MQSRYDIKGLAPQTYLISDKRDSIIYMLYVNAIETKDANIVMILAATEYVEVFTPYSMFTKEIMNVRFWARDWPQVINCIEALFGSLHGGADISNPVEDNLLVGTLLCSGKSVSQPILKGALH